MFKIKIISVGKTKERWLEEALSEYIKRLQPIAAVEYVWAKNDRQLVQLAEKENALICLDVKGRTQSSEQFAEFFNDMLIQNGSRLAFVIGGDKGLPAELKQNA